MPRRAIERTNGIVSGAGRAVALPRRNNGCAASELNGTSAHAPAGCDETDGARALQASYNEAAEEIRALAARTLLDFAASVGRVVLQRLYGGDEARWHSHGGKQVSLRALAEMLDPSLHLSASSLHRCVAIAVLLGRSQRLQGLQSVTPTHVRCVLKLAREEQERLLVEAEEARWTVRELEDRVRQLQPQSPPRGRPARSPFLRDVERVSRLVDAIASQRPSRDALGEAEVQSAFSTLMRLREKLDALQWTLGPKHQSATRGAISAPAGVSAEETPRPLPRRAHRLRAGAEHET